MWRQCNRGMAIDVRAAQFLPCRITLLETPAGVEMAVVDPPWVSESLLTNHDPKARPRG